MEDVNLLRLYYGNALTDATEAYKQENIEAREAIEKNLKYVKILRYMGMTQEGVTNPGLVFDWDISDRVGVCDLFIGNFTVPATGLGAEFVEAVRVFEKPALVLCHESVRLSNLIRGYEARFPRLVTIRPFNDLRAEIVHLVKEKVRLTPRLSMISMHGHFGRTCVKV